MTHTTEQERAEFEKHILAPNGFFDRGRGWVGRNPDGSYKLTRIQERWLAWQAARRAPAAPVPQWDGKINPADFNVETFRRSGNGWLVKPDNCVRITHVPTGLFEEGVSERSIHTNKAEAWERLSARLEALAAAQPAAQGWKLVQIELLERIQESLGSFLSDQGWSQSDMDTADALGGLLAAAPKPPACNLSLQPELATYSAQTRNKKGIEQ